MQSLNSTPPHNKCFDAFVYRLKADIDFIENRLNFLQKQRVPNKAAIKIHRDLLHNRKLALKQVEVCASQSEQIPRPN